jgi:hypothetical protein
MKVQQTLSCVIERRKRVPGPLPRLRPLIKVLLHRINKLLLSVLLLVKLPAESARPISLSLCLRLCWLLAAQRNSSATASWRSLLNDEALLVLGEMCFVIQVKQPDLQKVAIDPRPMSRVSKSASSIRTRLTYGTRALCFAKTARASTRL